MAKSRDPPAESATTAPRKGMPSPRLDEAEFKRRFLRQFVDPCYQPVRDALSEVADTAWQAYAASRKSPLTRKAGDGFADPDYELSVDWLAARAAVEDAQQRYRNPAAAGHVLIVNASSRSEHTCPGEMSKSYRLAELAQSVFNEEAGLTTELLDLSRLASEYGRHIYPCKACFSTAPALCHWPCSCYPNYSLGQSQDWMNDIYPLWVAAHGIMVISPVNWYQVSSPLKLMMDRLVCADGGNPDPARPMARTQPRRRRSNLQVGTIRAIWRGGCFRSWCTVTSKVLRTSDGRSRIGCGSCSWNQPVCSPKSIATSATGSLMRRATLRSMPISQSRTRYAMRPVRWPKR